jgi:hypothetical protein
LISFGSNLETSHYSILSVQLRPFVALKCLKMQSYCPRQSYKFMSVFLLSKYVPNLRNTAEMEIHKNGSLVGAPVGQALVGDVAAVAAPRVALQRNDHFEIFGHWKKVAR